MYLPGRPVFSEMLIKQEQREAQQQQLIEVSIILTAVTILIDHWKVIKNNYLRIKMVKIIIFYTFKNMQRK